MSNMDQLAERFASLAIWGQERSDQMIATLEAMLELDPTRAAEWRRLAEIYQYRGDLDATEVVFVRATEACPNDEGLARRLAALRGLRQEAKTRRETSEQEAQARREAWGKLQDEIDAADTWQDLLSARMLARQLGSVELSRRARIASSY